MLVLYGVVGNRRRCGPNIREKNRIRKWNRKKGQGVLNFVGKVPTSHRLSLASASQKSLFMKETQLSFLACWRMNVWCNWCLYTHGLVPCALLCCVGIGYWVLSFFLFELYQHFQQRRLLYIFSGSLYFFWTFLCYYYLCVFCIIFTVARLAVVPMRSATPFLFRLPHSSPSLFFHFVIFLLIQKGSETDDFLLCYDDHTKEKKKTKKNLKKRLGMWWILL